ncbi:MAG: carbon-nitrogen hydrolase family protein [Gammaproteobacteria bacterium]|nr:carbon-nitrogen hydrolase family protein [Gammaproteobacteria bacterium]MBQ0838459.1 carbon-nitrogen hydrolase family protein [Gammaproteobacteria bacterium]
MAKIAAIQLKSDGDPARNLDVASHFIGEAAKAGAQLVVLPEHFVYYNVRDMQAVAKAEAAGGLARQFFTEQAKKYDLWLVAGTLPLFADPDNSESTTKPYATSLLYDASGREVAAYQKIHLFDVKVQKTGKRYCESDSYGHGTRPVVAATPCGRVGMSVCYDLRFPELYRQLAEQGAEIMVAPSAFTAATGQAHWQLLLRARAVENLSYVVGANLCHRDHPKKPTWGGSAIIDPWGEVLAELDDEEGFITADIDLQRIKELRQNMPVLEHRRLP